MEYEPFWALENVLKGKPLVVCGNGPSLADVPEALFEKNPTMACNSCYARGYFKENVPDYYVIEGLGHLKDPEERQARVPYLEKIGEAGKVALINRRMTHHFQHMPTKMYFIDYVDHKGQYFSSFQFDPFLYYGSGHCVTYCMLQFAYYLTDGPVLMVGMDHKFIGDDWHFFPDKDVPAFKSMKEEEYDVFRKRVDPKFEEVAEVYRVTNRDLYNLTPNSAATMFEGGDVEEWL